MMMRAKLSEVCVNIFSGGTPSTKDADYWNGSLAWLSSGETRNCFITKSEKFISSKGVENSTTRLAPKGSTIVASAGEGKTRGQCSYMLIDAYVNQSLIVLIADETKVLKEYLYYFLKFNYDKIRQLSNVTGVRGSLSCSLLGDMEIYYPDLITQQKITNILFSIDNQIQRNSDVVHKLQVLGNTIYGSYAKTQDKTLNIKKMAEIIWGQCPLGENILTSPSNSSIPYASGAGDIDDDVLSVMPKGFTDNPLRIAQTKDVCISVAGTVGKMGVATENMAIGRAMLSIRNPDLYGYLYFAMNSYKNALSKQATGAIQKIINNTHLETIYIPLENKTIADVLNDIVDRIIQIEHDTLKLNQLKNKLLPLLINGQLSMQ